MNAVNAEILSKYFNNFLSYPVHACISTTNNITYFHPLSGKIE